MESMGKYVSIYKIDGVPILPPLMTKERRQEMKNYRDLAIALETKLKLEREIKNCNLLVDLDTDRSSDSTIITTTFEDEYLKVSNLMKSPSKIKSSEPEQKKEKMKCLQRSDIFICDVTSNILTIPCTDEKAPDSKIEEDTEFIKDNKFPELCSTLSYANVEIDMNECDQDISSISVESSSINGRLNGTHDFNEYQSNKMPKRFNLSQQSITSLNSTENQSSIIRSNSFTLDTPSDALIKHIVKCKTEELHKAISQSKIQKHGKDFLVKANEKISESDINKRNLNRTLKNDQKYEIKTNSNSMLKSKKNSYEFKSNGKSSKTIRKNKNQLTKTPSSASIKHKNNSPISNQNTSSTMEMELLNSENSFHHVKKMIEEIESKHRLQLNQLLEKQQKEQKLMRENFEKQQALLVEKLTLSIANKKGIPNNMKSVWSDEINSSTLSPSSINKSSISSCHDNNSDTNESFQSSPKRFVGFDTISSTESLNARKKEAATKINAFVRGYLTRRLFKTEYIKRIVQTIRDTLLFVLDLHMETKNDDNEVNIKLKARLLQQLTSAYQNLYKVFLEYSVKERMDIIAKDRKLLKSKVNKYQE